jgi:hypothetical protein
MTKRFIGEYDSSNGMVLHEVVQTIKFAATFDKS